MYVILDFYNHAPSPSLWILKQLTPSRRKMTHVNIRFGGGVLKEDMCLVVRPGSVRVHSYEAYTKVSGPPVSSYLLGKIDGANLHRILDEILTDFRPSRLRAWMWYLGLQRRRPDSCVTLVHRLCTASGFLCEAQFRGEMAINCWPSEVEESAYEWLTPCFTD